MANKKNQPQNRNKITPILIAATAAVVLVAVILLLCLPGNSAAKSFQKAAKKTLFAENFTTVFTLEMNDDTIDGIINAAIDPDKRELNVYMQLTTRVSDYICGIYNNQFAVCTVNSGKIHTEDITDRVNCFFDALEKDSQPNWELLLDFNSTDLYEQVSQDFDFAVLLDCLKVWVDQLNDADWAGYSKERENGTTVHRFDPDPYTLICQSLPYFAPAFRNAADYSNLQAYIEDVKYLLMNGKADFSFGIKNRCLESVKFDFGYHNTRISGNFSFIGIGSTIVDTETIAFYIEEAK